MEAFVYCWTDIKTNKLYVGSHKGTVDDGYVCSSKLMNEQYKKRPQDFKRQIIAFGSFTDIRKLEEKILNVVDARHNDEFYNQHNGNGNFYLKGHTDEYKKRQSELLKGKRKSKTENYKKNKSESHKKALSLSKKGKKRKPFTDETKKRISNSLKNYIKHNPNARSNRRHKDVTKQKISNSHSKLWKITIPNGDTIQINNLKCFCVKHDLNYSCMIKVAKYERKHHKGYVCEKI